MGHSGHTNDCHQAQAQESRTAALEYNVLKTIADGKHPELSDAEILDLLRQLQNYRELAIYLGDCIAATAEDLLSKKGTSKYQRGRQAMLVLHTLSDLKHETSTHSFRGRTRTTVIRRLESIVKDAGKEPWNGLCAAGKHGLDFRTQPCDLCAKEATS